MYYPPTETLIVQLLISVKLVLTADALRIFLLAQNRKFNHSSSVNISFRYYTDITLFNSNYKKLYF